MIHLYTGDGKGKTTAAIGLAVRAAGRGKRVCFSQFMKGNDTGELHALALLPQVELFRSEKNFGFYRSMSEFDKAALTGIHNDILYRLLSRMQTQSCDLMVLDEITYPVNWGLLDVSLLKQLLSCPGQTEIVLTGREPADFLIECADYLTEMRKIRHPYEKGVAAREGVEF